METQVCAGFSGEHVFPSLKGLPGWTPNSSEQQGVGGGAGDPECWDGRSSGSRGGGGGSGVKQRRLPDRIHPGAAGDGC